MTFEADNKPKLGVSSCLLGFQVRHDGGHKHDRYLTGTLGKFFEFVPVCPEAEIGLGTPRESLHLEGDPEDIRVRGNKTPGLDITDLLRELGNKMGHQLSDLSGYILKSRSPSCGMERVARRPRVDHGNPGCRQARAQGCRRRWHGRYGWHGRHGHGRHVLRPNVATLMPNAWDVTP